MIILEAYKDLPPKERILGYLELPEVSDGGPLSEFERDLVDSQIARETGSGRPWMAVGEAGLEPGDVIRPPDGGTSLSISDVPYIIESTLEMIEPPSAACAYLVEPRGPLTIDPAAFRLSVLCALDPTLDPDSSEVMQAMMDAACTRLCEAARVVQVLTLPPEIGPKH